VRGRTNSWGGAGHHDLHANAAVLQEADNLGRFVGRDAAGYAQSYFIEVSIVDF